MASTLSSSQYIKYSQYSVDSPSAATTKGLARVAKAAKAKPATKTPCDYPKCDDPKCRHRDSHSRVECWLAKFPEDLGWTVAKACVRRSGRQHAGALNIGFTQEASPVPDTVPDTGIPDRYTSYLVRYLVCDKQTTDICQIYV